MKQHRHIGWSTFVAWGLDGLACFKMFCELHIVESDNSNGLTSVPCYSTRCKSFVKFITSLKLVSVHLHELLFFAIR